MTSVGEGCFIFYRGMCRHRGGSLDDLGVSSHREACQEPRLDEEVNSRHRDREVLVEAPASRDETFRKCILATRAALLTVSILYAAFSGQADDTLQALWAEIRTWRFFKAETCEPLIATFGFGWSVTMFRVMDRLSCFQRYKFTRGHENSTKSGMKKSFLPPAHAVLSLVLYLAPLVVFDSLYPRRKLPIHAPSLVSLLAQVTFSVVVYDFLMFWCHLSMHKNPALRFVGHTVHHTTRDIDATEVVRHSLLDGSLQVAMNIVALNLIGSHPLSRALHNIVVTYLLSESHSGYDLPFMAHNVIPAGIFGGSVAHEIHHRTGRHHYQQFFTYLDRSLGLVPGSRPVCDAQATACFAPLLVAATSATAAALFLAKSPLPQSMLTNSN